MFVSVFVVSVPTIVVLAFGNVSVTDHHSYAVRDVMRTGEREDLADMTGIHILDADAFPAPGSWEDRGIGVINRPQLDGSLPLFSQHLPVPPLFK